MFTCKQVAKALAKKRYDDMSSSERWKLRFHVTLCFVCGKFHKDVIQMQRLSSKLGEHDVQAPNQCLSSDCRDRIKSAMAKTDAKAE